MLANVLWQYRRNRKEPNELPATSLRRRAAAARDHLWLHFTRMSGYTDGEVPIIVRGDGCYLEDIHGKRYLDALAGLFAVNIGYGFGEEIGEAAAAQAARAAVLHELELRAPARDRARGRGRLVTPGDLNRVFFCSGGSEAVESAWKLAPVPRRARRAPLEGDRAPHRLPRHDDGGALHQRDRRPEDAVRAARSRHAPRPQHEPLPPPAEETEQEFTAFLLDDLEEMILHTGPDTVAMVIMEPVQNAGGSFAARRLLGRRARDLRPLRDPPRRRGHHRLRPGRRLVRLRALRHPARPDHLGEGLSSAHASIGASSRPTGSWSRSSRTRPCTRTGSFGGHPVQAAIALKNIEIMRRERIVEHVAEEQDAFRSTLAQLLDLPIVGDLRGTGFYALELVKDKETRETFSRTSARRSCAASSRRGCSSPASSAARTTAATRSCRSRRPSWPAGAVRRDHGDPRRRPRRGLGRLALGSRARELRRAVKAMVLALPGTPLRGGRAPRARAGPGPGLVAVDACGVCRTDLHVVDGELPDPKLPLVPGHQIVGRVAEAAGASRRATASGSPGSAGRAASAGTA